MARRWKSLLAYPLLSLFLLASCDPGGAGAPGSPTGPALTQSLEDYTLVETSSPLSVAQQTARLIGGSGGVLTLLGSTLTVPSGAVGQPTLFTMIRLPGSNIEVELSAIRLSLLGGIIDVGAGGFLGNKTVQVKLSYADATNVSDPSRLVVLYLRPDGGVEEIPTTVDAVAETVTVELEHFSRYCMAID